MKVKTKNAYNADKSHIGDPVTKEGVVVGHITDITEEYIFADVDLLPEDLSKDPTSFSIRTKLEEN